MQKYLWIPSRAVITFNGQQLKFDTAALQPVNEFFPHLPYEAGQKPLYTHNVRFMAKSFEFIYRGSPYRVTAEQYNHRIIRMPDGIGLRFVFEDERRPQHEVEVVDLKKIGEDLIADAVQIEETDMPAVPTPKQLMAKRAQIAPDPVQQFLQKCIDKLNPHKTVIVRRGGYSDSVEEKVTALLKAAGWHVTPGSGFESMEPYVVIKAAKKQ